MACHGRKSSARSREFSRSHAVGRILLRFRDVAGGVARETRARLGLGGLAPTAIKTASKMLTDSIIKAAIKAAPTSGRNQTVLTDKGARGEGRLTSYIPEMREHVLPKWEAFVDQMLGRE